MFKDFMSKVRYWDNQSMKWMMRNFYILFFEIVLVVVFVFFFVNVLKVIDLSIDVPREKTLEQLLLSQSINTLIIVFLLLMNSFWMLYIFGSIIRMRTSLRDLNYQLTRRRDDKDNF